MPVSRLRSRAAGGDLGETFLPITDGISLATDKGTDAKIHERRVHKVLALTESQPLLSVRELATEIGLSAAHLERLFKEETGARVGEVLVGRRLQKAADLLSATETPVKQIAHMVGYEHHSSFVRAFQRRFQQTPTSYRRVSQDPCRPVPTF
jgi:AraC-like DNA-binding protein